MKLMRFIRPMKNMRIASLVVFGLLFSLNSMACGYCYFLPKEYLMYKLPDNLAATDNNTRNCLLWQKLTSTHIPLADIMEVVYKYDLERTKSILSSNKIASVAENKFEDWLRKHSDREIVDFLVLAKECETLRDIKISPWYYPTKNDSTVNCLADVVKKSFEYKGSRLKNRYMLQGIRAMFSLGNYNDCIDFWQRNHKTLPDDVVKDMLAHYVAGAYENIGNTREALALYTQLGDYISASRCMGDKYKKMEEAERIGYAASINGDSDVLLQRLEQYMRNCENYIVSEYDRGMRKITLEQIGKLLPASVKAASGNIRNKSVWWYTAAFISYLNKDFSGADKYLTEAEKSNHNSSFEPILKVLRFYIDAQTCPYSGTYEKRILGQLKWFESMIRQNLTSDVKQETGELWQLNTNFSYFYWNDMMRKIMLGVVCPRMIKAGNETRALQVANTADYMLIHMAGIDMTTVRRNGEFNVYDYSSSFFSLADTIGVKHVADYVKVVQHPKNDFDRFLNKYSYTDYDFLNDLIGTLYLRNRKYPDAMEYLSKVPKTYEKLLNTKKYLTIDPFNAQRAYDSTLVDAKFRFAQEMSNLEHIMNNKVSEPNRKALAQLKYALGLKNSFSISWAYTHYELNCDSDWPNSKQTKQALADAEKMRKQALEMFTDDEMAAEAHAIYDNYISIAKKYRHTQFAKRFAGTCDSYRDYIKKNNLKP